MSDHYCCKTCGQRYDCCTCTTIAAPAKRKEPNRPAPKPETADTLRTAALMLYFAGRWRCDRPCDEAALWSALRDALSLPPGTSPPPL